MTHIPVGKRLPVTEYIPLPQPRPVFTPEVPSQGLDLPHPAGMPLEASEKAAGAFSEVGSYPTSGEGVNRLYDLPSVFTGVSWFLIGLGLFVVFVYLPNRVWIKAKLRRIYDLRRK